MASYDQLPAQQRAIVDLVLKRGRSYDQLADTLALPVDRVRELAQETLTSLAPVSAAAVDEDWRAQIADYLLGQQSPPEAAATRGHLRRSEAGRAWSRSVLDSLDHLYANGDMPTIPSGDAGPAPPPPSAPRRERAELSPEAAAVVRRRRIAGGAVLAAAALALILLVWPVGLLVGDGDGDGGEQPPAAGEPELLGQAPLRPVAGASENTAGIATAVRDGDEELLQVLARVRPTNARQAYEVWLFDSEQDAVSLGVQRTSEEGEQQINFAGEAVLPDDWRDYRLIDISREPIDEDESHSGRSVLRVQTAEILSAQDR